MSSDELIAGLPGEDIVRQGMTDLLSGRWTIPACLVAIARTRFVRAGLLPAEIGTPEVEPELQLYRLLRRESGDAFSRYNALVRELVSFASALDARMTRNSSSARAEGFQSKN